MERQQKVKEDLYIFLLNKREENALNGAMTDSNARIIDSPSGSDNPVYPASLERLPWSRMWVGITYNCSTAII